MFSVVLGYTAMSKIYAEMDRSRPSPSSPRLPVCGPVQSDFPIRPDRTEPYCGPGSSGLVESLDLVTAIHNRCNGSLPWQNKVTFDCSHS